MLTRLRSAFAAKGIEAVVPLSMTDVTVTRPHLLTRLLPFSPQSVILFLVPYYTGQGGNLSAYAVSRDYHHYMQGLFSRLSISLSDTGYTFCGFADHSPIDEREAAARAGLGVRGENGLLIHPRYGSFVFIGELFTDAPLAVPSPRQIVRCEGCGACRRACPTGLLRGESEECLSAVTQQKTPLTEGQVALLRAQGSAWGCDACQLVCPHNRRAVESGSAVTPIRFFHEARISSLTQKSLAEMSEAEFALRAYSFRGRAPLARNLAILEETDTPAT